MLSPALGQIFEQMCRISVGAGLIYFFKDAYQGYLAAFFVRGANLRGVWRTGIVKRFLSA